MPRPSSLTPVQIASFFARLKAANPHPETELDYTSPFELLVAVVLSAQATDASVNRATRELFAYASTPESMLALGEERLERAIQTIGLFRTKARNVLALSRLLLERHAGEVPDERTALEALPGVGRKTANVILNTVFGQPTMAVDTHVFRVANRTGLARGENVAGVEERLVKVIPSAYIQDAHHWLILHGRYVCRARDPACGGCVIEDLCLFEDKRLETVL
jgi:endonuclease-3